MRKIATLLIAVFSLFPEINNCYGQGCSDAGFCTINSFKPATTGNSHIISNQFKAGVFTGKADNAISVYGTYLEYNRQLTTKTGLDIKLTTLAQQGNGISRFGLADLFVNTNFSVREGFKVTLGTKVPLSAATKTHNNLPLPMDYQASLGTLDFIAGISYQLQKIQLAAALQQPLIQNNNRFLASAYPVNSELNKFQSTNNFIRSGDVLLRASYPLKISTSLIFTPGILSIYHLTNDFYTDELNEKKAIAGSKGFTLNANAFFDYTINRKNSIQLNFGSPFITRATRPDGLTRSFIATLEYVFSF